ncbi:MAG: Nif3-like dinuclear metal center hexameric protein [Campylobacteraceae bacterium]|jgi:dinuclear metal center YbgI/SA1388 family protein|nr:Nif3-like dinuclear metal center hexameric protein [Campylobacteraceae bacterium]
MKIEKIYEFLNSLSPFELQEEWDNSGLIAGSMQDEAESICICLDLSLEAVLKADKKTLFIVHHPLVFKSLKKFDYSKYPTSILKAAIAKECAIIAMHTNIDKTHLNRFVLEEILDFKTLKSDGFISYFETDKSFDELVFYIKERLQNAVIKVVSVNKQIKKAAFCAGSGGDLLGGIEADCFISGDFKYHHAIEAKENNIALIDAGHFESERYFPHMLSSHLKNFPLKAIITDCKNPFEYK